jgi:hypothetical protein
MTLVDRDVAVAAAVRALGATEGTVLYVDRAVREPGTVTLGAESHQTDRPCSADSPRRGWWPRTPTTWLTSQRPEPGR